MRLDNYVNRLMITAYCERFANAEDSHYPFHVTQFRSFGSQLAELLMQARMS